jgi:hypothetical protein
LEKIVTYSKMNEYLKSILGDFGTWSRFEKTGAWTGYEKTGTWKWDDPFAYYDETLMMGNGLKITAKNLKTEYQLLQQGVVPIRYMLMNVGISQSSIDFSKNIALMQ